jgi:hypothetical protein
MVSGSVLRSTPLPNASKVTAALDDGGVAVQVFRPGESPATSIIDAMGAVVATDLGTTPTSIWTPLNPAIAVGDTWVGLTEVGLDYADSRVGAVVAMSTQVTPVGFSLQGGNAQGQNAPRLWYQDAETAALAALDFIFPFAAGQGVEWGGLICAQDGGRYLWSRLVTSHLAESVDVFGLTQCAPYGTAVANYHTHTLTGEAFPSGFLPGTALPNDAETADAHPELTFDLKARRENSPPQVTHILRYRKTVDRDSRDNVYRWENGEWIFYPRPQ